MNGHQALCVIHFIKATIYVFYFRYLYGSAADTDGIQIAIAGGRDAREWGKDNGRESVRREGVRAG